MIIFLNIDKLENRTRELQKKLRFQSGHLGIALGKTIRSLIGGALQAFFRPFWSKSEIFEKSLRNPAENIQF